jgi:hypothetical protein
MAFLKSRGHGSTGNRGNGAGENASVPVVVIGAARLSVACYLRRSDLVAGRDFILVDLYLRLRRRDDEGRD